MNFCMKKKLSLIKRGIQKPHLVPSFVLNSIWKAKQKYRFKQDKSLVVDDFRVNSASGVANPLFRHSDFRADELNRYAEEIHQSELLSQAHQNRAKHRSLTVSPPSRCFGLYSLVRQYSPDVLVETGVFDGLSTVYLLEALRQNDSVGHLYSIDDPAPNLPLNKDPGWIIPSELRSNWDLILGKSQDKLEPLLNRIDSPDLFYHDSWHTYPVMNYEFQTAAENMSDGIISGHDVNRNHAYLELCSRVNSSINVDEPFRVGHMGVFGYAFIGDLTEDIPQKYPEWQY